MLTVFASKQNLIRRRKKISMEMDKYALEMMGVICQICEGGDTASLCSREEKLREKMSHCSAAIHQIDDRLAKLSR